MIGKTISHYKILEKLGEGGMGVVYKAEDTKLKREVALKFLPRQISASEEERKRFKIEAQAAGALNHPNIATIHAIDDVDDETFIVMEYIDGEELKEKIKGGRLPVDQTIGIATQIANGLQAAHKKGITHRDIKSSNIMITDEGQVKVMDFGLAKLRSGTQVTKSGTTLGTVAYMSPEQVRGEKADHRSDIWSFGVVLYEMLAGKLPFHGDYDQVVIYAIQSVEPQVISEERKGLPPVLEAVVKKALTKDVDARYQHIDEVVNDLLLIKKGRHGDISTHELRRYKVAQSWSRKPRIASLIVALILGGVVATFFLTKQNDQLVVRGEKESRRSIAVIGFKNLSGQNEIAWLSTALAEMLTTELAAGNELRTVPGEVIDRMKTELTLSEAVSFGKETLMKIRQNLGTDLVVLGSFVNLVDGTESQIRLDVRLQDTIAGETVASLAETGNEKELFKLISRAGVRLREVLGVSELDVNFDCLKCRLSPKC